MAKKISIKDKKFLQGFKTLDSFILKNKTIGSVKEVVKESSKINKKSAKKEKKVRVEKKEEIPESEKKKDKEILKLKEKIRSLEEEKDLIEGTAFTEDIDTEVSIREENKVKDDDRGDEMGFEDIDPYSKMYDRITDFNNDEDFDRNDYR